jgi:hypothetical protein
MTNKETQVFLMAAMGICTLLSGFLANESTLQTKF